MAGRARVVLGSPTTIPPRAERGHGTRKLVARLYSLPRRPRVEITRLTLHEHRGDATSCLGWPSRVAGSIEDSLDMYAHVDPWDSRYGPYFDGVGRAADGTSR